MSSITERIQQANLTKKERSIIEKITRDIEKTAFLNGIGLAERYDVSATFITRLIQKLGYEKFADFKKELGDRYQRMTFPKDMYKHFLEGGGGNIVKASITQDVQNISNMETMLDKKMLNKVVSAIEKSDTVYMVAMFGSEVAVDALFYYLGRLGRKRRKVKGVGLSKKIEFTNIGKDDVLFAFSSQRIVKEVVAAAEYARKQGAKTVAITDNATNPLACACDYTLLSPVKGVAIDYTNAANIAMINVIINCLAERNPEKVQAQLEEDERFWKNKDIFCM